MLHIINLLFAPQKSCHHAGQEVELNAITDHTGTPVEDGDVDEGEEGKQ